MTTERSYSKFLCKASKFLILTENQNQNKGGQGNRGSQGGGSPINLNLASKEELIRSVQGIGESTAQDIIDYRDKNGGFKNTDEIDNVYGIDTTMRDKIKEQTHL